MVRWRESLGEAFDSARRGGVEAWRHGYGIMVKLDRLEVGGALLCSVVES